MSDHSNDKPKPFDNLTPYHVLKDKYDTAIRLVETYKLQVADLERQLAAAKKEIADLETMFQSTGLPHP